MPVDPSVPLPDNYEWEEEQLNVVLEEFLGERVACCKGENADDEWPLVVGPTAAPYRPFTTEPPNWRAKSPAVIKLEKHHRT
jgi:hypothetical protein